MFRKNLHGISDTLASYGLFPAARMCHFAGQKEVLNDATPKVNKPRTLGTQIDEAIKMAGDQISRIENHMFNQRLDTTRDSTYVSSKLDTVATAINAKNSQEKDIAFSSDPATFAATAAMLKNKYPDIPGVFGINEVLEQISIFNAPEDAGQIAGKIWDLEWEINKKAKTKGEKPVEFSADPKDFAKMAKLIEEKYSQEPGAKELLEAIKNFNKPKDPTSIQQKLASIADYINNNREDTFFRFNHDPSSFPATLRLIQNRYKDIPGAQEAIDALNAYQKDKALSFGKNYKEFQKNTPALLGKFGDSPETKSLLDAVGTYFQLIEKLQRVRFGLFENQESRRELATKTMNELNVAAGLIEKLAADRQKNNENNGDPLQSFSTLDLQEVKLDEQSSSTADKSSQDLPKKEEPKNQPASVIEKLEPDTSAYKLAGFMLEYPDKTLGPDMVEKAIGKRNIQALRQFIGENNFFNLEVKDPANPDRAIPVSIQIARHKKSGGIPVALRVSWEEDNGNVKTPHTAEIALQSFVSYRKKDNTVAISEDLAFWQEPKKDNMPDLDDSNLGKNEAAIEMSAIEDFKQLSDPRTPAGTNITVQDREGRSFKIIKKTNTFPARNDEYEIKQLFDTTVTKAPSITLRNQEDSEPVVERVNSSKLERFLRKIPMAGRFEDPSEEVANELHLNSIKLLANDLVNLGIFDSNNAEIADRREKIMDKIATLLEEVMTTKSFDEKTLPFEAINKDLEGGFKLENERDGNGPSLVLTYTSRGNTYRRPLNFSRFG